MRCRRDTWLIYLSFLLLVAFTESDGVEKKLTCHNAKDNEDTIVCEFIIDKKDRDVKFEHCQDDYCIKAAITKEEKEPVQATDSAQEGGTLASAQQNKDTHEEDSVITLGSKVFEPPYEQYGKRLAQVLSSRPKKTDSPVEDTLALADWYAKLGRVFREDAKLQGSEMDWSHVDASTCILAFEKAIDLYIAIVSSHEPLPAGHNAQEARLGMAVTCMYLAESHQFHPSNPSPEQALRYYTRAQQNFKIILESKDLDQYEREQIELDWADTLAHAAVIMIDEASDAQLLQDGVYDISQGLAEMKKAEGYLDDAIQVFRKTASRDNDIMYKLQLSTALNNRGASAIITASASAAIEFWEEARSVFAQVIPKLSSHERQDTVLAMAELLLGLSDAYLQAGNFDYAKIRYKEAMECYQDNHIPAPSQPDLLEDSDDLLEESENKLEEYQASLYGGPGIQIPDDYKNPEDPMYEPDDIYEADLHARIGAIQVSRDQTELAMTHFVKAIDLYETFEGEERSIADVKLNMATALFRMAEFDESARAHGEAIELYRQVVGDGNNPLADFNVKLGAQSGDSSMMDENTVVQAHIVNLDDMQTLENVTSNDEL